MALDPRLVQGAESTLAAGALPHDAVGYLERALHGQHGIAQGHLFWRAGGNLRPFLAALHETGARELRLHAGEQPARHRGPIRDPIGRQ